MFAKGTNSLIKGNRGLVRLPRRMRCIWVRDPKGCARPLRARSVPAIKVVATAPMPGKQDAETPVGRLNLFGQLWIVGCLFAHVGIFGDIIC